MACRRGTRVGTVQMKIHSLEAVEGGSMAEARVIGRGTRLAVVDCDIGGDARSERLY